MSACDIRHGQAMMHERVVHGLHHGPANDDVFEYPSSLVVTDGFPVGEQESRPHVPEAGKGGER